MSKLLALDSSTDACSVALHIDGQEKEDFRVAPRQHTQLLLPMVDALLAEAGLSLSQLDGIVFGRGPGSFTGLRITTGVVQGLAFGADLPVIPISTLQALAQGAYIELQATRVLAALDARMNEVYWGAFEYRNGRPEPLVDEGVFAPEQVPLPDAWLRERGAWCGYGLGWCYQDRFPTAVTEQLGSVEQSRYPRARDLVHLGSLAFAAGEGVAAEEAQPTYLRNEITWKKLPGR